MSETIKRDNSMDVQDAVRQAHHGDVVRDSDGVAGIVIDDDVQMEKNKPQNLKNIENYLEEQNAQIRKLRGEKVEVDTNERSDAEIERENIERLKNMPNDGGASTLEKLIEASNDVTYGPDGLVPKNSPQAKEYERMMGGNIPPEEANIDMSQPPERVNTPVQDNPATSVETIPTETTFNVPEGQANIFLDSLPQEARENAVRSKQIVVNEVIKKEVPVVTRKISSLSEFKRVLPRKSHSETIDVVLPNSGFVATFKGCGSMAMASLTPDENNSIDYQKRYQFAYDNLVSTSIGKLSFAEFCDYVALRDISICIFAIYRMSEPENSNIVLQCGEESCRAEYSVDFKVSELVDSDSITKETAEQIDKIVKVRDIYEDAKRVWKESPLQTVKSMDIIHEGIDTITIELKQTNGTTMIERAPEFKEILEKYNQYILGFLLYTPRILYTIPNPAYTEGGNAPKDITYEIDDPAAIADIISELDDDDLQTVGQVLNDMTEYSEPTYSFKGRYQCPNCGRVETKVPCTVDSLVFYKVGKAIQ